MMQRRDDPAWTRRPELLAAYVDDELDPIARREMDAWLAFHPEERAKLEAMGRLTRLYRAAPPRLPRPPAWIAVYQRIEQALVDRKRWGRPWPPRLTLVALACGGLAAALLCAALLPREPRTFLKAPANEAEPYLVVSPEDVEIVRVHADDRSGLVVGTPPIDGTLDLASAADVQVDGVRPDRQDLPPTVRQDGLADTPMVVTPIEPAIPVD